MRNNAKQSSCSFLLFLCDPKALKFTLPYCQNGQPREPYYRKHFRIEANIEELTNTVTQQKLVIQNFTDHLENLENNQITSENNIYQLEKTINSSRNVSKQTVSYFY